MKKIAIFAVLCLSVTTYAKEVPGGPIWYTISEKILAESQRLIGMDKACMMKNHASPKTEKGTKVLKVSSKYQQKKELVLPDYFAPPVAKNVWFLPE